VLDVASISSSAPSSATSRLEPDRLCSLGGLAAANAWDA
jgi:hypothetical protein